MKVILILCMLGFLLQPVAAYRHVSQGDTVYLNETVDLTGFVPWHLKIVWTGESGPYILDLPDRQRTLSQFYINRTIFENRLGVWHKWNPYQTKNENTVFFVVKEPYKMHFNAPGPVERDGAYDIAEYFGQRGDIIDQFVLKKAIQQGYKI